MNNKISCLILGAGGHARVLIDCLRFDSSVEIVGVLDSNPDLYRQTIDGVLILGNDDMMAKLSKEGVGHFVVGLGGIGNNLPRQKLFELGVQNGLTPLMVKHPTAIISQGVKIGNGCQFLPNCIVNTGAKLGNNVIVNSGSIVEHDCIVVEHAHISTGARLAGGVYVGTSAHVGIGATLLQGVQVGANAIIGAGAVVIKDVEPQTTVVGVPAQVLERKRV